MYPQEVITMVDTGRISQEHDAIVSDSFPWKMTCLNAHDKDFQFPMVSGNICSKDFTKYSKALLSDSGGLRHFLQPVTRKSVQILTDMMVVTHYSWEAVIFA